MIIEQTERPMTDYLFQKEYIVVNPVNRKGVMGAGVAKWFKQHYPKAYHAYQGYCKRGEFASGDVLLTTTHIETDKEHYVAHVPSKHHYSEMSSVGLIGHGMRNLANACAKKDIVIVTTKIGCGLGGLNWSIIEPLLTKLPARVIIATGQLEDAPNCEAGSGHVLLKYNRR